MPFGTFYIFFLGRPLGLIAIKGTFYIFFLGRPLGLRLACSPILTAGPAAGIRRHSRRAQWGALDQRQSCACGTNSARTGFLST